MLNFLNLCAGPLGKSVLCHSEHAGCASAGDLASFPLVIYRSEILRYFHGCPSHMNTPGFCGCDTFGLPLANELTFRLRHIAQKLENDVCDERSCEIPSLPGVQQWHVQHHDGSLLFSGDDAPLLQYFFIVAAQPVDALDDKGVARF